MIEKYGMSAFKSPVQEKVFSSFESPSPIALQKTFSVGKRITSLGVTQTTLGISLKNYLVGLENGQIFAVDRSWLDPRRPMSEPTQAEKLERLGRYVNLKRMTLSQLRILTKFMLCIGILPISHFCHKKLFLTIN